MKPISVVIPAYNEANGIANVIKRVKAFMDKEKIEHEIIVVNDCSTDNTASAASGLGATIISHPVNRGYGASLTTGLKKAKFDNVLIMDADESYPVDDIGRLLPYVDDFDMVVGARQGKYYHGSLMKRLSRMVFYMLLGYVTGEKVPDANSGLRIFKKDVVMRFEDDFCSGFSFTTTITIILLSNKYTIKFVPINYMSRTGKSKVRHLRDTARTIQILLHTIAYYNPIKTFLPFSYVSLFLSAVFTLMYLMRARTTFYGLAAVGSFFFFMLFLSFGIMTYAIIKDGRRKR